MSISPRSFLALAIILGSLTSFASPSYADAQNIQMLPPLDFNGLPCDSKNSTGGLLYWDGSNPIRCVPSSSGNASGFIGIGTSNPQFPLQIGADLAFTSSWPSIGFNAYYGGSPAKWRYLTKNYAGFFQEDYNGGGLYFATAPVGNAGDALSFANPLYLKSNGNVGINTMNPVSRLQIVQPGGSAPGNLGTEALIVAKDYNGGGDGLAVAEIYATDAGMDKTGIQVAVKGAGGFGKGWPLVVLANGSTVASVDYSGEVKATAYYHGSDVRLKEDVTAVRNPLDIIGGLRGVAFTWKKDGQPAAGVIAQDVEKVMPSAVKADADGYLSVDYDQLMAPMIEAIKLQQAELRRQEAESAALRKEFESYKAAHP